MTEPSVNHAEPDDMETLNMYTAHIHPWNSVEYVRIAVLPKDASGLNGTISLVLVQFHKDGKCKHAQAMLDKQEIDVVIKGLQDAKERMERL